MIQFRTFKTSLVLFTALITTACVSTSNQTSPNNWNKTVKRVSNGVVSIQMDVPVSFDGKWNSSSTATGFVVDKAKGLILTNRHVVTPGPVTAKAIFINNEEVELTPVYIDPVHDFGFYQYKPEQLKHIQPHEFSLNPNSAHVGQEIRIIGNDAGQKVAILDGTISRLDRDAPNYGLGRYNDFNTFYIQAATASTGGSSGSPVINIKGEAVALNAGSQSKSANAFYLPLYQVQRALEKLQQGQAISRGTIQTTFELSAFSELKRLGLSSEQETQYRQIDTAAKGLLVIKSIIPASSAANNLAVGDILLKINDQAILNFIQLESFFNDNIGQSISMTVQRQSELVTVDVKVDDLEQLLPKSYLKMSNNIFHDLSYQQARHFNLPVAGVYLAQNAGDFKQAGIPSYSLITELNDIKINNLEQFKTEINKIADGEKVHLRYTSLQNPTVSNYALVEINRNWFEYSYCKQNIELGYWPCANLTAVTNSKKSIKEKLVTNSKAQQNTDLLTQIQSSLVQVKFSSPYSIQGRRNNVGRYGTGLVVDAKKGWVIVDKSVVFSHLGDAKIIFNNQVELDAKIEYLHPIHNLALISYQPEQIENARITPAKISKKTLKRDDPVIQVGLNYDGELEYRSTQVDLVQQMLLREFRVPQHIQQNLEVVHLVNPNNVIDGVLLNQQGEVAALWSTFEESGQNGSDLVELSAGILAEFIHEIIDLAQHSKPVYSLELSLNQIPPIYAVKRGLPKDWLSKILASNPESQKLLAIYNIAADTPSSELLKRGDILLAIDGNPVSSFRQVEKLTQKQEVEVTYFRAGKVDTKQIKTTALNGVDIEQVLYWSGMYLHTPHRAAQLQAHVGTKGLYIASYNYGSPATRYSIYAMRRIIEIDGKTIDNTEDFIQAVKHKQHQDSVLIKTIDFSNNIAVQTLKLDNHYWPFTEVKFENNDWKMIQHN
ncbi:trypsin-like peptidase domain-containing protein [Catenovulum maritimum]|uniref:PDZ domain-containing protein n=1 Tax=Catenovulum maritimum TaxID=1513271 RepID=A0A0J8GVH3_9ALTE|nr:trypsin-like peptidase domain-containing protein [Catenovulum maritimum]KMT66785.1 hypothetical protein XM47_01295 [Catenovulum maritimum]